MPLAPAHAQKTLRAVMHSDLKILDPIWTTAYIVRNHGYMIYDTLFATDEKGEIKPQMVDKYEVSADKLTHTFTLRDGLLWHDGQPVTAEDCVASIKRWAAKDSTGQKLMTFVDGMEVKDAKTFVMKLKEPTGLVLLGLGKPSSNVPFMMPKRVAETDPNTQISDFTGSGPFVFKRDEWKPGDKTVYVKFDKYKPRSEPASGPRRRQGGQGRPRRVARHLRPPAGRERAAGRRDRLHRGAAARPAAAGSATPTSSTSTGTRSATSTPSARTGCTSRSTIPRCARRCCYAFNQEDFLKAVIGDAEVLQGLQGVLPLRHAVLHREGHGRACSKSNFKKAQELLKEAGYDGTPIVLMHSTDLQVLTNLAPVAKSLMEKAGFKVDMQSMDWQTVVARRAKKDPPNAGGWHAFLTSWVSADITNPDLRRLHERRLRQGDVRLAVRRGDGEAARRLRPRDRSGQAEGDRRGGAGARGPGGDAHPARPVVSGRALMRKNVDGMLTAPAPVFWNIAVK